MEQILDQLRTICDVLHCFYYRNRNQHRQGHWWKWLSLLKRCVKKLGDELEGIELCRVRARVQYMKAFLLPKCYVSFTQLVRDNQFSALGLALFAELAKIRRTITSHAVFEGECVDDSSDIRNAEGFHAVRFTEDFGEVVGRSPIPDPTAHGPTISATNNLLSESSKPGVRQGPPGWKAYGAASLRSLSIEAGPSQSGSIGKQKYSSKKGANPIDDLFDEVG